MTHHDTVNKKSVTRVIKRRTAQGNPLMSNDLRELAVEIVAELGTHPVCVHKAEETIMFLMKNRVIVHIDGVLRPRKAGDPVTLSLRDKRINARLKTQQRDMNRRRAKKFRLEAQRQQELRTA